MGGESSNAYVPGQHFPLAFRLYDTKGRDILRRGGLYFSDTPMMTVYKVIPFCDLDDGIENDLYDEARA